jgi:VanZ family protein
MSIKRIALPVLTVGIIAFIWIHSMIPGDESAAESGFVLELIKKIIGDGAVTEHIVRKMAHFTEYMVLGIICYADLWVYGKKGFRFLPTVLYICLAVAVIDESIQLFTVGRSGMLFDVWLDHLGSIFGAMATCVLSKLNKRNK